jgi:hypothetical protein
MIDTEYLQDPSLGMCTQKAVSRQRTTSSLSDLCNSLTLRLHVSCHVFLWIHPTNVWTIAHLA